MSLKPALTEWPWGYHRYNGRCYLVPYLALKHAMERGDKNPEITFEFPSADRVDWTVEPEEPLEELYRHRAQALREQYDYLILMYSGGSDSHNVLTTFLNNGIRLDEIRTYYPVTWANRVGGEVSKDNPLGLLFEYNNTVVPGLSLVKKLSPGTKIKVVDTTNVYTDGMSKWYDVLPVQHRTSGGAHGLFVGNFRAAIELDLQRYEPPRDTGVIYGVDKPAMYLNPQSELFIRFPDTWRMGISHYWVGSTGLFTPEMFYWGDLQITCKQVHVIKRALEVDPWIISNVDAHRQLIYPTWTFPYQSNGLHGDLLSICTDQDRVRGVAAERTGYYTDRYRPLGIEISEQPTNAKQDLRFLFARDSKLYRVGQLSERK
jgi:hypothetical protein